MLSADFICGILLKSVGIICTQRVLTWRLLAIRILETIVIIRGGENCGENCQLLFCFLTISVMDFEIIVPGSQDSLFQF